MEVVVGVETVAVEAKVAVAGEVEAEVAVAGEVAGEVAVVGEVAAAEEVYKFFLYLYGIHN
jgi:hypothetical protein